MCIVVCFSTLQELEKKFDAENEVMTKRQKKLIEKLEKDHIQRFRSRSKTIKAQQVCFVCKDCDIEPFVLVVNIL